MRKRLAIGWHGQVAACPWGHPKNHGQTEDCPCHPGRCWLTGALVLLLSASGLYAQFTLAPTSAPAPKVQVEMLAERTALVPGKSVDLALRFTIEPGWHIYWRNHGETGLETTFDWKLPPGYRVGPMLFPSPKRHIDKGDLQSFVLEGKPVFLTTLFVPSDAPVGTDVTIGVKAAWLVCKGECIQENKFVSRKMPVMADAAVEPNNASRFKAARAELSLPMEKAQYLERFTAVANVDKVKPGESFKVAVVAVVQADHHVNSHEPLDEYSIPTDVFNDTTEGLSFERPIFPPGKVEASPLPGEKLSLYHGRTVIILPAQADAALSGDRVRISGIITYQACNDKTKKCFPQTSAEWAVTLPVARADEKVSAANAEIFSGGGATSKPAGPAGVQTPSTPSGSGFTWLGRMQLALADLGIVGYLLMAFVGGFILNLMPCVLPVISIKVLSFVQQAKESPWRVFTLGMAFSSGIIISFLALGILIVLLGQQWGGIFQYPQVVIVMAALVTILALSLFGVFTLGPPRVINDVGAMVQQEGHTNAFGMGLLATALGTACTAPFLGFTIAVASQQTPFVGMLIFLTAGLGMAIPYVLLALKPGWLKLVPRPGPWMLYFEHIMGFLLLGTVVWLMNTLNSQLGGEGLVWTLLFLLCVSLGMWFYGRIGFDTPLHHKFIYHFAMFLCIAGSWWLCFHRFTNIHDLIVAQGQCNQAQAAAQVQNGLNWTGKKFPWIPYSRERADQAVASGRTIFIDYTAEWCANCKANEKIVIDTQEVRQAMERLGVLPFRADYTSKDPDIKADLDRHGRAGVPMYLIFPAKQPNEPILLDELLTTASLIAGLEKAGPSIQTSIAEK